MHVGFDRERGGVLVAGLGPEPAGLVVGAALCLRIKCIAPVVERLVHVGFDRDGLGIVPARFSKACHRCISVLRRLRLLICFVASHECDRCTHVG